VSHLADSVIHDLGYQRYGGVRLGRWHAVRALYVHSLRTAFGLGRGTKAKIFPWSIAGLVCLVAVIITAVQAISGKTVVTYPQFDSDVAFLVVLFTATVATELVSRDLAAGVLPLYFSRPLQRGDYAMAKLAAVATAVVALLCVPQLLMFAGSAFSTKTGLTGVWHEAGRLVAGLLFALIIAVLVSAVGVFCAALTRRRAFAAVVIVGGFLVPKTIAAVLGRAGALLSPLDALTAARVWIFEHGHDSLGPLCALVVVALTAAGVAGVVVRYRRIAA
jgi:ABC-2 type transport system permease protein